MSKDLKDSVKDVSEKVEAAIDQGKEQLKGNTNQAKDDLHDLKNDAKDKFHDAKNSAKDSFHDIKNKADDHFSGLNGKAEDFAATAEDEFNRLYGEEGKMESLVNFVRDRPILSLGAAAVVGIILTKLLKCCCRKHR
ncbi:hypothetical protein CIN_01960 [Commensalibacter intestini A911]|uniref:CsbD-like domain-containing protein n=1 Tax=Commensalibacter intestini A911 TaxID=1088868 RepID=G6EXM6_9PROT|nr:hypothetical protein [Commensalibacter intestini]EHD14264.1 hypothetical protein CIN_01960 [Commensalibacter intestini A911]